MTNKFLRTYKKEFASSNCGFDHEPVESIVRSQWQSRSQSYLYLLYRWIVAIVATVSVIISFAAHVERYSVGLFFIYLTHWGILINMIVALYGAILVTFWHFHAGFKGMHFARCIYICTIHSTVHTVCAPCELQKIHFMLAVLNKCVSLFHR